MRIKHYILIITVLMMSGCASFDNDNSKDMLMVYVTRQNMIIEQRVREQEKAEAVKKFQMQAIKAGFAYWDVDESGSVTFRWIGQRIKK